MLRWLVTNELDRWPVLAAAPLNLEVHRIFTTTLSRRFYRYWDEIWTMFFPNTNYFPLISRASIKERYVLSTMNLTTKKTFSNVWPSWIPPLNTVFSGTAKQLSTWWFRTSGMWHCVAGLEFFPRLWRKFPSLSRRAQGEGKHFLCYVRNCLPSDLASHSGSRESTVTKLWVPYSF
jgi:hypothetical protein